MWYLIAAIGFGSTFSILFKLCQRWGVDRMQVIFFNYVTAALTSWGPLLLREALGSGAGTEGLDLCGQADAAVAGLPSMAWVLAPVLGLLFMSSFIVNDLSVKKSGVALTTVSVRLSLVIPVLMSWLLLGQSEPRWLSVALILAAMILIALSSGRPAGGRPSDRKPGWSLVLVFLTYGVCDFLLKYAQHIVTAEAGNTDVLKAYIFLSAMVLSFIVCLSRGSFRRTTTPQPRWKAILAGIFLGLANMLCTTLVLKALGTMPATVFFPLYNIGIVLVVSLVGILGFREPLRPGHIAGLLLAAAALAILGGGA